MFKAIKHFRRGYTNGKKRLPCHGQTIAYEKGYYCGLRAGSMTSYDKNILIGKICFFIAVFAFIPGVVLAYRMFYY